jgi:hypothetical protein
MTHSTRLFRNTLLCCFALAGATTCLAQAPAAAKPAVGTAVPPAQIYGKLLTNIETEFVSAADAMPEDKFDFAPTQGEFKGVRTFGEQVKHVTEANLYYFHDPATPLTDIRAGVEKLKTKAEIMQALKDSLAQAHKFVDAITPDNAFIVTASGGTRAGMAAMGSAHMLDHYGQMVEYLRMNGIVPPASRSAN